VNAKPTKRAAKKKPPISEKLIKRWYDTLMSAADIRWELARRRGISDETVTSYQLGYDATRKRYTIPVRDSSGRVVNVRLYSLTYTPKMKNYSTGGHRYGSPPRLFGIDELVKTDTTQVILCEGEWDRLLLQQVGFTAITSTHGATTFKPEWTANFKDKHVVVMFDCDETGKAAAEKVVKLLAGANAASVKNVTLPLSGQPDDKDVTDYFMIHMKGNDDLQALIDETPIHQYVQSTRPVITTNTQQLSAIYDATWEAIFAVNDPPQLFKSNGYLSRIADPDIDPHIQLLTESAAYGLTARVATWNRDTKEGPRDAKPPKEVAADLVVNPHPELPVLDHVVSTPVFGADGRLIARAGYHPAAKIWYHRTTGFHLPLVLERPTPSDRERALGLLLNDLLVDFPFTEDSDRAHALAALILPFVRRLISGCTPIHLIEAPTPGSGKTLFSDLISIIALGLPCEPTTVTKDENETRKKITALLLRGRPIVLLDNIKDALDSGQLSSAVTAETWSDRILGKTQIIDVPNRATWIVTANNPRLTTEIARRCIRIRIDPGEDRPWERENFKHHPIQQWAADNRAPLVHAILTLVQSWLAAGRPVGGKSLGSFYSWSETIGGILDHAGVTGFLENTKQFYQAADQEGEQWRAFVEVWWEEYGDRWVSPTDLFDLADRRDLISFVLCGKTERAQKIRLGKALGGLRDRRFGDRKLVTGTDGHKKITVYRLVVLGNDTNKPQLTLPIEQKRGMSAGCLRDIEPPHPAAQQEEDQ